jgi:hypothetical protein
MPVREQALRVRISLDTKLCKVVSATLLHHEPVSASEIVCSTNLSIYGQVVRGIK